MFPTVLTPADESHHIDKHKFTVPFVCGARDLGEALRRIAEGAAMIRTKGQAGTGEKGLKCPPSPPLPPHLNHFESDHPN